jgi:dihydropteroate synthase
MNFADKQIDLSTPRVMGILNVTPDSFSDGGQFNLKDNALRHVENMLNHGADFIDIGGESTKPGAKNVSIDEELDRTIPVIERVKQHFDTIVSIDTSKAVVMKEAVKAGAGLINDVRALQEPNALEVASVLAREHQVAVCLMHMQGAPATMQQAPSYQNVVDEVSTFLAERKSACLSAGIAEEQIILDPGFGFGKSVAHNYCLLAQLKQLQALNCPLLVGVSRKSMIGKLLDREVEERLAGSLACATYAVTQGASIIRVHDVKESVDAIKTINKIIEFIQ